MTASNVHALPSAPSAGALEPPLRMLVREAIEIDPSLTQAKIAREIGVSGGLISAWLSDSYTGDNVKLDGKMRAWYEQYQDRRANAGLPDAPEWYETPSTERVHACLRYGQLSQTMVCVYGPPGVSKTKAIQAYARTSPGVYIATMSPATKGVQASLKEIATACGLRELPTTPSTLQNMIVAKLAHTRGLLAIDESQHLTSEALEQIRSLHDRCAIGMAIIGNDFVYSRMHGGTKAQFLLTLKSRISRYTAVKGTDGDIDALIENWKIQDKSCREQIRQIGRRPGALRTLTHILRLAASFAAAQNRTTCCDDVRLAIHELGAAE